MKLSKEKKGMSFGYELSQIVYIVCIHVVSGYAENFSDEREVLN